MLSQSVVGRLRASIKMKFLFIVFLMVIQIFNGQVDCNNDLSGFEINEPVDYSNACGEPFDGEFPWLVKVYRTTRKPFQTIKQLICNGNIIDKTTILLPGHCIKLFNGEIIKSSDLSIDSGDTTSTGQATKSREYLCRDVIVHPMYDFHALHNDIAILKLTDPIEFSSYIHPICLTNDTTKLNTTQLGITPIRTYFNETKSENFLKTEYLPIIYNNDECIRSDPQYFTHFLKEYSFCAGKQNESYNLCRGPISSGVSLTMVEETSTKFIWYLKGFLSHGKYDPLFIPMCAPGYLVFTDVTKFYDWINENKK